jgi:hypothetical protein
MFAVVVQFCTVFRKSNTILYSTSPKRKLLKKPEIKFTVILLNQNRIMNCLMLVENYQFTQRQPKVAVTFAPDTI